jgi:hypothetical protein
VRSSFTLWTQKEKEEGGQKYVSIFYFFARYVLIITNTFSLSASTKFGAQSAALLDYSVKLDQFKAGVVCVLYDKICDLSCETTMYHLESMRGSQEFESGDRL